MRCPFHFKTKIIPAYEKGICPNVPLNEVPTYRVKAIRKTIETFNPNSCIFLNYNTAIINSTTGRPTFKIGMEQNESGRIFN